MNIISAAGLNDCMALFCLQLDNGKCKIHIGGVLYLKFLQLMIVTMFLCSLVALTVLIPIYVTGFNQNLGMTLS